MTTKQLMSFLCILSFIAALCCATPLQQLQQQLPLAVMDPQQLDNYSTVKILKIDGDWFGWNDSQTGQTAEKPLFVYNAECSLSFITPADALAGDSTYISFVWCEADDTECKTTTAVEVLRQPITLPNNNETAVFKIPTMTYSKFFSSNIKFQLAHIRGEGTDEETQLALYKSKYVYPSDITTKTTKGVVTVVIVFCVVAICMALAVIGYFIYKKCKKMRRTRHFPASQHNVWRRS